MDDSSILQSCLDYCNPWQYRYADPSIPDPSVLAMVWRTGLLYYSSTRVRTGLRHDIYILRVTQFGCPLAILVVPLLESLVARASYTHAFRVPSVTAATYRTCTEVFSKQTPRPHIHAYHPFSIFHFIHRSRLKRWHKKRKRQNVELDRW